MRHKQRPIKSSRHKSVTSLNDCPQTTFEHNNVRHMNDVMRLAFLENNDISPETCKDTDFNSLSTASILKRNIQQQLQQQLKEQQLRAKQQELIQQQLFQKQQQLFRNQQQLFQKQQRLFRNQQLYSRAHQDDTDNIDQSQVLIYDGDEDGLVDVDEDDEGHEHEDENGDDHGDDDVVDEDDERDADQMSQAQIEDDYLYAGHSGANNNDLLSDSRIFATDMPTTSCTRNAATTSSTPIQSSRASAASRRQMAQAIKNEVIASLPALEPEPKRESSMSLSAKYINKVQVTPGAGDTSLGEFMCDEPNCGKSFPSSRKLRHHKVVHSDEHPFQCQFKGCEKKFKRKFGIDLHSTTHFDLDPEMYAKTSNNSSLPFFGRRMQYSMCKPCGERFKTVHEYQNHMVSHGKDPFKCPVKDCGQTFSIWKSFQKHRASHYFNYYCKMDPRCEHSTSNLQLLKLHIYCCHFQRKLPSTSTMSQSLSPSILDKSSQRLTRSTRALRISNI